MAKVSSLCLFVVLLSIVFEGIQCQYDDESGDGGFVRGWWARFREKWRDLTESLKELVRELAKEVNARTSDFQSWTKEMFTSFTAQMRKLLQGDLPQEDRNEVESILQRLQKYESEAQRR